MEKYYSIAIRKRVDANDRFFKHDDFVFSEVKINIEGRYWLADPFLFEHSGLLYLFYEAFDMYKQRGVLAYSIVHRCDGGGYYGSSPKVILDKKYHLSFPYIFKRDNEIYLMPETCGDDTLRLFKAVDFPNVWKEHTVLLKDVFVCDSIFMKFGDKEYLLCSEQFRVAPDGKVVSCYVKNRLFDFDTSMMTVGCSSYGYITSIGEVGIRNAGQTFTDSGKTVRVGQNCEGGVYGKGLRFFTVDSVSPYSETLLYGIDCTEMQKHLEFSGKRRQIIGTHTYNSTDGFEVIDFSYNRPVPVMLFLYRKAFMVLRQGWRMVKKMLGLQKRVFGKLRRILYAGRFDTYEAVVDAAAPWIFASYIAEPFYHASDEKYLNTHQNRREVLEMAKVFNRLGYNAYFMLHTSTKDIPDRDFRLIFGHEPNFVRACKKYPAAKKIFYGVSVFYEFRNEKIKEMTDYLNESLGCAMPYRRLVEPHESVEIADGILLIGSEHTKATYPEHSREKITLIHQSTQIARRVRFVEAQDGRNFLFLASYGNALKGVAPLLEYFKQHSELTLHWVGPVEPELRKVLSNVQWGGVKNVRVYGFLDINSDRLLGIMEKCDFIVYPSGVEGVPGSVLNAMKSGLIPLVTPWASFDDVDKLGFVMKDATVEGISDAVTWALSLSADEITRRKRKCSEFIDRTYTLERFSAEFETYMRNVLQGDGCVIGQQV